VDENRKALAMKRKSYLVTYVYDRGTEIEVPAGPSLSDRKPKRSQTNAEKDPAAYETTPIGKQRKKSARRP
jgi:hypothetical protein